MMASDDDEDDNNDSEARKRQKLEEKRAYSRQVSARARQRQKDELAMWATKAESNKDRADKFEMHNKELEEKVRNLAAANQSLSQQVQLLEATTATASAATAGGSLMLSSALFDGSRVGGGGGGPGATTGAAGAPSDAPESNKNVNNEGSKTLPGTGGASLGSGGGGGGERAAADPRSELASANDPTAGSLFGAARAAAASSAGNLHYGHHYHGLNNEAMMATLAGAAGNPAHSLGGIFGSGSVVNQLFGRNPQNSFDSLLLPTSQNFAARDILYHQQQQLELERLRAMRRGSGGGGGGDNIFDASDISVLQRYLGPTSASGAEDIQGLYSTTNFASAAASTPGVDPSLAQFLDRSNQEAIRRMSMAPSELARAHLIQQSLLAGQHQMAGLLPQGDPLAMSALAAAEREARERQLMLMAALDRDNNKQSDEANDRKPAAK